MDIECKSKEIKIQRHNLFLENQALPSCVRWHKLHLVNTNPDANILYMYICRLLFLHVDTLYIYALMWLPFYASCPQNPPSPPTSLSLHHRLQLICHGLR